MSEWKVVVNLPQLCRFGLADPNAAAVVAADVVKTLFCSCIQFHTDYSIFFRNTCSNSECSLRMK